MVNQTTKRNKLAARSLVVCGTLLAGTARRVRSDTRARTMGRNGLRAFMPATPLSSIAHAKPHRFMMACGPRPE